MKKIISALIIAVVFSFILSSCATIFTGSKCKVYVPKNINSKVDVFLDGNYVGEAPTYVRMSKSKLKDGVISIRSEGYSKIDVKVGRKPMVGFIVVDAVFNPLLSLGIDFIDGDIYRPSTKSLDYVMFKY